MNYNLLSRYRVLYEIIYKNERLITTLIIVSSSLIYIILFQVFGRIAGVFIAIPIVTIAWLYGTKFGIVSAVLLNLCVYSLQYIIKPYEPQEEFVSILITVPVSLLVGGGIGWLNDIRHQLKINEGIIQAERRKLEKIVDIIPDGVIVLHKEGEIILMNQSFLELSSNLLNKQFSLGSKIDIYSPNLLVDTIKSLITVSSPKTITIEPTENFHLKLQSAFIKSANNIEGYIIQIQDVSSYIELDNLRKHVLTTISHELRSPITSLSLSANNLKKYRKKMTEYEEESLLLSLVENSNTMNHIIQDLLTISSLEEKIINYKLDQFDLDSIMKSVIVELTPKISEKSIKINYNSDSQLLMHGDGLRIAQVLRIFLDNAIKYSPLNSTIEAKIRAHDKDIDEIINHQEFESFYKVSIKDEGIGIPKKEIPFIFDKFFRASNANSLPGTGIGLAIAQEIVKFHQGIIRVKSDMGKGTEIIIILPQRSENPRK